MSLEDCAAGFPVERLVPAKNGCTVCAGEITLHSRYNPMQEAEKYIASLNLKNIYRYFILIEPGLGYLAAALEKQFPHTALIILHCSSFYDSEKLRPLLKEGPLLPEGLLQGEPAPSWNPSCKESLEIFLDKHISGADASGIRLIEWKPSVNAYGKICADLAARTVECIRRITAGKKTVEQFGRRWLRNALRNLELFGNPVEYKSGSQPVLVCAAGPGLEDSLGVIAEWRQSPSPPLLIAVSSAAPALLHRNILPDIIAATDGGPWALFHLYEYFRGAKSLGTQKKSSDDLNKVPVIAAALTAALPSQAETQPILILSDGSLWQEMLLGICGIPFARFPQRGTVSATALDLAFSLSEGSVYLAGLDFSHRDLKTHARPYAFEKIPEYSSSRYKPVYSQTFERESAINKSGSLKIYAEWFKTHVHSFPQRLYTLSPSSMDLPQADNIFPNFITQRRQDAKHAKKEGIAVLLDALSNPLTAKQIEQELGELLFPGNSVEEGNLAASIKTQLQDLANG